MTEEQHIERTMTFVESAVKAINKVEYHEDHLANFDCPICGKEALALWRDGLKGRELGRAKCDTCGISIIE